MDFTLNRYKELLTALKGSGVAYQLRHDVDLWPERALRMAEVEKESGATATYYFREGDFDSEAETIRRIAAMGHSIGYHYESLTTCRGNMSAAYNDFCRNLDRLRSIVPVETACAHGSPGSIWDSQDIWKQHDIHTLGIKFEPMLDTDFNRTLYLTDTGRRWDGWRVSIRDKVPQYQRRWEKEGLRFRTTNDIIRALGDPSHPIHKKNLLVNSHPQRWTPFGIGWMKEMALQNCKNIIKRILVTFKSRKNKTFLFFSF